MTIRQILVPTDFSAYSNAALERATELAKALSARIHLVHSYWVTLSVGTTDLILVPPDFVEKLRVAASSELEQLEKKTAQAGVPCEAHLSGDPAVTAILDLAKSLPADLIAMGTHGHTGLRHLLLGSVAERIVRLAPCPVLTVKAKDS
jgi:nucleotide-binding universal stress UspA family protein